MNERETTSAGQIRLRLLLGAVALAGGIVALLIAILLVRGVLG